MRITGDGCCARGWQGLQLAAQRFKSRAQLSFALLPLFRFFLLPHSSFFAACMDGSTSYMLHESDSFRVALIALEVRNACRAQEHND